VRSSRQLTATPCCGGRTWLVLRKSPGRQTGRSRGSERQRRQREASRPRQAKQDERKRQLSKASRRAHLDARRTQILISLGNLVSLGRQNPMRGKPIDERRVLPTCGMAQRPSAEATDMPNESDNRLASGASRGIALMVESGFPAPWPLRQLRLAVAAAEACRDFRARAAINRLPYRGELAIAGWSVVGYFDVTAVPSSRLNRG